VFRWKAQIAAAALLAAQIAVLGGCGRREAVSDQAPASGEAGYVAPPAVTAVSAAPDGTERLTGEAPAGAPVRLATPQGESVTTKADAGGRWNLQLPKAAEARIFGLSAQSEGRAVQAEGYLLLAPNGEAALLRAGATAVRLDSPKGPGIATLDLDAEGGGLLSGWGQPGTDVALRLDGGPATEVRADNGGRFSFTLPRLRPGAHRIEAVGVRLTDTLAFDTTPPAPLVAGPLRSQVTGEGLRADWLTPGGGVQSTILAISRSAS
jgi:hypothetical protein